MTIGLDAKRAFLNESGLGSYSRTLIRSLLQYYPENNYRLFTSKVSQSVFCQEILAKTNASTIQPSSFLEKKINALWRSYKITSLLAQKNISIYHGLSNELPLNIRKFAGRKIVTIHDLIFLRKPELFPFIDNIIYGLKFKNACMDADTIIAVSQQTKNDIIEYYKISPDKIHVIYQSAGELFFKTSNTQEIESVRRKYNLPENYLLYVGTIEKRKNLITLLKALTLVKEIPLVVIGKKRPYFKEVQEFIHQNKLDNRVFFQNDVLTEDLPTIYQSAKIFIYPSIYEGFGIPIIEALASQTPVITTRGGCFEEAGGKDSIYIDPLNHEQLADEINKLLTSSDTQKQIAEKGIEHVKKFHPKNTAENIMHLYRN